MSRIKILFSQSLDNWVGESGWSFYIIFVPDFNKLPYSLRSQGDNEFHDKGTSAMITANFVQSSTTIQKYGICLSLNKNVPQVFF